MQLVLTNKIDIGPRIMGTSVDPRKIKYGVEFSVMKDDGSIHMVTKVFRYEKFRTWWIRSARVMFSDKSVSVYTYIQLG